jgi:hypothetical protein
VNWATTFIVGGGPSAGDLDTVKLAGLGTRLGVNDAALHKPVDAFFSNDHNYVLGIRPELDALGVPLHFSVWHRNWPLFEDWHAPAIWRRIHSAEPASAPGCLSSGPHGTPGCSGYVAINLAVQMGARRIALFGYDFHDAYTYFFSNEPHARRDIQGVIRSFHDVAKFYRKSGVEIVNANPDSAITSFNRMSESEVIAWAGARQ